MDSRQKKKALIGVAAWFVAPILAMMVVALCLIAIIGPAGGTAAGASLAVYFLVQYVVFFWNCSHLAKAKGYSTAITIPGVLGPIVQLIVYAILWFGLPDKFSRSSMQPRRKSRHHGESPIARIVRYRRNALVANSLGIAGILLALFLFFVPSGFFLSHDNDRLIALIIFVPGYASIIYGCWWWVRAKGWHEAVIFIGLMPLGVLGIRYVRLIYIAVPLLLPAGMVLMPIIMIGVVAVLPDKSGMPQLQRRRSDRSRRDQ